MAWQIDLTATSAKQLAKLDRGEAKRITTFLRERLATIDDPRSTGKALTGPLGGLWRYRIGDYRVICEIQDSVVRILVVEVGHRRDVYQ